MGELFHTIELELKGLKSRALVSLGKVEWYHGGGCGAGIMCMVNKF